MKISDYQTMNLTTIRNLNPGDLFIDKYGCISMITENDDERRYVKTCITLATGKYILCSYNEKVVAVDGSLVLL